MNTLLVIIGVRGAGKSTLLEKARGIRPIKVLQPSTTRPARDGEGDEYHRIEKSSWRRPNFAWTAVVKDELYGMRNSQLEGLGQGEIGLTVFYPGFIADLEAFRKARGAFEVVTIGLDTIETYEEQMQRIGSDTGRDEGPAVFADHREIVRKSDVVVRGSQETVFSAFNAIANTLTMRGVLDRDSIAALIKAGSLLRDTAATGIQSASYDLRVGEAVWCRGKVHQPTAHVPVTIPAYSYVIIQAKEQACLPKFIVAHYDLTISLFTQGAILSNGPQVDPGYDGALLCALFNASDSDIGLKLGEHFATMEFLVTTRVTSGYAEHHQAKKTLTEFMQGSTIVGPGGTIVEKLGRLESSWEKFRNVYAVAGLAFIVATGALTKWAYEILDRANQAKQQAEQLVNRAKEPRADASAGQAASSPTNTNVAPTDATAARNQRIPIAPVEATNQIQPASEIKSTPATLPSPSQ